MAMLMLESFSLQDRQNFLAMLTIAEGSGVTDSRIIREQLQRSIDSQYLNAARSSQKYRREPQYKCAHCGSSAVLTTLNTEPGNQVEGGITHAIQCQNRPGKYMPWLPIHCGHTEYIVRGV